LIVGHHDLNPAKDCPCIPDVATEYKDLQPHQPLTSSEVLFRENSQPQYCWL
jgi:hypothetical protein